ncbi:flagellar brake protein [Motiliproteus sp.]|uniref:flagellar brake protein n=1 Tax=Motiliproteus sp. TaxID=1898955 RepID=UPI003BAA0A75
MSSTRLSLPSAKSDQPLSAVKEQLRFDELQLRVGDRIRIDSPNPRGRFTVRYLGAYPDQFLLVSMPVQHDVVKPLRSGTRVQLRFVALDRACVVNARVLKAVDEPQPMLWLSYPEQVEAARVRELPRVATDLIVSVDEAEPGHFGGGWPRQALCSDLSLRGACIEAGDQLGEIGDGLLLTLRLQVDGIDQVLLLESRIRSLEEVEDSLAGGYRMLHGVEFAAVDEDNRLVLAGFVYQQLLLEQFGPGIGVAPFG